jgi:dienelactone hydrolase
MKSIGLVLILLFSTLSFAQDLPPQPTAESDPGSAVFHNELFKTHIEVNGRGVDFFAPATSGAKGIGAPVIVFGHGQALSTDNYELLFEHLAKKGYAVVCPSYDSGFFDQDWRRMGSDYANLARETLKQFASYVNPAQVVFSGHSKGAYIALVAAGLPAGSQPLRPSSVVAFEPAGFDAEYAKNFDPNMPVTITHGDRDTVVSSDLMNTIYDGLPSKYKQLIEVASYVGTNPELDADHYFVMTQSFFMGGHDGLSPFHYYGAIKWLIGAAQDVVAGSPIDNTYLFGAAAADTGLDGIKDQIHKSW